MAASFESVSWVQCLLDNPEVRESVCNQHFKQFDTNRNNHLETDEIRGLVRSVCQFLRIVEPKDEFYEHSVAKFDVSSTGGLTLEEFRLFFAALLQWMLWEMEDINDSDGDSVEGAADAVSVQVGPQGSTRFECPHEFVLVAQGDMPLVISVPHGGTWAPDFLPDQFGITQMDHNTMPLARTTIEHITRLSGGRTPYSVMLGLHRSKLDANRDKGFQCPNKLAQKVWEQYHGAIEVAIEACLRRFGGCHLIDVHGTAHYYKGVQPRKYIKYAEIGYGLSRGDLSLEDADLDTKNCTFTLGRKRNFGVRTSEVVRGEHSLGAYLELAELPGGAVPSNHLDRTRVPTNVNNFFNGGGRTVSGRHSIPDLVTTSQIEFPRGVRFSGHQSEFFDAYAGNLAKGILEFLWHWFGPCLMRHVCVVERQTVLLRNGLEYADAKLSPLLKRGEVCRYVEEGQAIHPETGAAQKRIRLVAPMCGWANKDLFNVEKGACVVKADSVLLRAGISLDSEKLTERLAKGTECRWVAQGRANTVERVRVVTIDGSIVGWGSKQFFEFMKSAL